MPDMTTLSPLLSGGDVDINADTFPLSFAQKQHFKCINSCI